jgi:hypothetical protein
MYLFGSFCPLSQSIIFPGRRYFQTMYILGVQILFVKQAFLAKNSFLSKLHFGGGVECKFVIWILFQFGSKVHRNRWSGGFKGNF